MNLNINFPYSGIPVFSAIFKKWNTGIFVGILIVISDLKENLKLESFPSYNLARF